MAVITISRQHGSAGDYIANLVATMLSYKLVTKQSIIMEAQRRGIMESEIAKEIGEGKPQILERFIKHKSRAIYSIRSIIRESAIEGNVVILGRGGNMELRDRTDVINIRIIASFETRITRVMQEEKLDRTQAIKLLKKSDKDQYEYVKHFFLVDLTDPQLYDIVINTSKIPPDAASRMIVQMVRSIEL